MKTQDQNQDNKKNDNEPKYYVITGIHEGKRKYFNVKDKNFYERLVNASICSTTQGANQLIRYALIQGGRVDTVTESELVNCQNDALTKVLLTGASLHYFINDLSATLPTKSMQLKKLNTLLKNIKSNLLPIMVQYNEALKSGEDNVYDVHELYDIIIDHLSKIDMYKINELDLVLKAFKKDSKSLVGIAKKINK